MTDIKDSLVGNIPVFRSDLEKLAGDDITKKIPTFIDDEGEIPLLGANFNRNQTKKHLDGSFGKGVLDPNRLNRRKMVRPVSGVLEDKRVGTSPIEWNNQIGAGVKSKSLLNTMFEDRPKIGYGFNDEGSSISPAMGKYVWEQEVMTQLIDILITLLGDLTKNNAPTHEILAVIGLIKDYIVTSNQLRRG